MGSSRYNGNGLGSSRLRSEKLVSISVSPRGGLSLPEPIQLPRLEEGSVEMHEGGMPRMRGGVSNEGSHFGFAVGKVHRSRMYILSKMC